MYKHIRKLVQHVLLFESFISESVEEDDFLRQVKKEDPESYDLMKRTIEVLGLEGAKESYRRIKDVQSGKRKVPAKKRTATGTTEPHYGKMEGEVQLSITPSTYGNALRKITNGFMFTFGANLKNDEWPDFETLKRNVINVIRSLRGKVSIPEPIRIQQMQRIEAMNKEQIISYIHHLVNKYGREKPAAGDTGAYIPRKMKIRYRPEDPTYGRY